MPDYLLPVLLVLAVAAVLLAAVITEEWREITAILPDPADTTEES